MTAPITSNGPITTRLHHYAGRYSRWNVNGGVCVVNYAGFGAEYAVSVCVNGLQWVSSTPNFRTLRAEVAAKVTLTHEKEGSDGTRCHY